MSTFKKLDVVDFSSVEKQLKRLPKEIIKRLQRWSMYVEYIGIIETRKIPGFHDEPLKGKWKGYRSVRLGHKWRAIYKYDKDHTVNIIKIKKVTAHDY